MMRVTTSTICMQIDKLDLHFNMELSKIGMKQELSRKRKRNSSRQVTHLVRRLT